MDKLGELAQQEQEFKKELSRSKNKTVTAAVKNVESRKNCHPSIRSSPVSVSRRRPLASSFGAFSMDGWMDWVQCVAGQQHKRFYCECCSSPGLTLTPPAPRVGLLQAAAVVCAKQSEISETNIWLTTDGRALFQVIRSSFDAHLILFLKVDPLTCDILQSRPWYIMRKKWNLTSVTAKSWNNVVEGDVVNVPNEWKSLLRNT